MHHVSWIKYLVYKSIYEEEVIYAFGVSDRDGNPRYPFRDAAQNL